MHIPPYNLFPLLESDRLLLRDTEISDFGEIQEISFYDGIGARNPEDVRMMHERIVSDYKAGECIHWLITSLKTKRVLGSCGFYRGFQDETGEIGYVLKQDNQGVGIMSEALPLVINFGWDVMNLKAISASAALENTASIKILKKLGFLESSKSNDEIRFFLQNLKRSDS